MNYFSRLIIVFLFLIPARLFSQVDSITITHSWQYFDGDTTIENIVDSFSTGIHVSKFVYDEYNTPLRKTNYTWGPHGLIDSTTESFVNSSWVYYHNTNNQYYPNDSLHISTEYDFIYSSGVYDTSGNRTTITFDTTTSTEIVLKEQRSINLLWYPASRNTYTFDGLHRLTYHLIEYGTSLQPSTDKYIYYLPNDSIDYYFYHTYQSGVLVDTDSVAYSYNTNGYLEQMISFESGLTSLWRPYAMTSFTYSPNGNMLSLCKHIWIDSIIGWDCFTDTTSWTYNSNNQVTETKTNYCGGGGGYHAMYYYDGLNRPDSLSAMSWPHSGDSHFWHYKMEYPLSTSVNTIVASGKLNLYPNPASGKLFINIPDPFHLRRIDIADVTGRLIKSEKCDPSIISMDISLLQPGIYFLTALFLDQKDQTIRFIKMN